MLQNESQVRRPLKILFLKSKMADGRYARETVLHNREILQFVDFQDGGCPSSWNFEIEIFNSQSLRRHVLHYHVIFCADRSTEIQEAQLSPRDRDL